MGNSREVLSLHDRPLWESIRARRLCLQRCQACRTFRYPPAPACAECLSMDTEWVPVGGRGTILSWVIFHRKYFDDFEPPYNAIAVQLEEGPIVISNLIGETPGGSWIGREVALVYDDTPTRILPRFKLRTAPS